MKIEQYRWRATDTWTPHAPDTSTSCAQLVFIFASPNILTSSPLLDSIRKNYAKSLLIGCSTAGEIYNTEVSDNSLVLTAITFEHSHVISAQTPISTQDDSFNAGEKLAKSLPHDGLRHTFVLSDGLHINGSELVRGLHHHLPEGVTITGGLAADQDRFQETFILLNDTLATNRVTVVGFYGDHLHVGYGSLGGWDPFGPERLITRSQGNVLYEFDNQSALNIYKKYLGDKAKDLPSSGLYFPLSIWSEDNPERIVRTILAVDEKDQSLTFAGDIPQGAYAQLMKANFDRLIDGASMAAQVSYNTLGGTKAPDLAILISCIGRKMVLHQRIEEEIENVRDIMGPDTILTGFYSYGEISPLNKGSDCALHNQTMTITTIAEC